MRSQGTFEYILLLGGVVIVVLLVILALTNAGQQTAQETNEAVMTGVSKIQQKIEEVNL